ncbi:hypothetical protein [Shewanella livingstonensis]|uniref:VWA domain-containing protein n=1 Tax=Shewanella livingstonensis TaxID=150120 RepID=A0A3G8LWZ5_9GAMM|nr:hypothetical protein [Shewanella livingstonensis]AZG74131.1 hypothetical protein EGC82_16040 [Shewanella livingstonensis]
MALNATKIGLCSALFLASTQYGVAAERNDIKSCYDYAKVNPQTATQVAERHLFVAIDGTFSPDMNIKKLVHQKVQLFLQPGDKITIINFSAYVEDFYTNILFTGKLDTDIEDRDDVSKKLLRKFDNCMNQQGTFVQRKVDSSIIQSFKKDAVDVPKTEILSNLSQVIAPIVAADSEGRRVLLLVSDMVENSDVTSFYASNSLKTIAPEQEITKVTQANMLSDFNQADIYVLGAGWIASDTKGFRGGEKMLPLKQFWSQYFKQSNAKLKAFGQPVLMVDM